MMVSITIATIGFVNITQPRTRYTTNATTNSTTFWLANPTPTERIYVRTRIEKAPDKYSSSAIYKSQQHYTQIDETLKNLNFHATPDTYKHVLSVCVCAHERLGCATIIAK